MNYSLSLFSVFIDATDQSHEFLFFLFNVPSACDPRRTDVTQPFHLLRACCFPGIAEFVRAARDVRELSSQVWLANCSKGRGRLWLSSSNSPASRMDVEEMSFVHRSSENEPTAILPRLFFSQHFYPASS